MQKNKIMSNSQHAKESGLNEEIKRIKLSIEADKLYTIHVGLERFLERWTKKRLIELEMPGKFEKHRKTINFVQGTNRFALAVGGILTLTDYPKIGGSISILYPLVELLISFLKEKVEKKGRKGEEFFKDSERLGNDLDKLSKIAESIKNFPWERLNSVSERLSEKIYDFLKEYDENKNGKIEVSELKISKFVRDLKEKGERGKERKLRGITQSIQILQKEISNYG